MKYLSIDTELGGLDFDCSLLSVALVVYDDKGVEVDNLNLFLKPDDGIFRVRANAMSINKMDIIELEAKGLTYKEGATAIYKFLSKHSANGSDRLKVIGKQVRGDLEHVWNKTLSRKSWEVFCSYRNIDITALAESLIVVGKIPANNKGSLESLAEFFGIKNEGAHDALNDARLHFKVWFEGMLPLVK